MLVSFRPYNNESPNFKALNVQHITKSLKEADQLARLVDEGKVLDASDILDLQRAIVLASQQGKKTVVFRLQELLGGSQPK